MTTLVGNLLYVLLPGLKAKAQEPIETVYAYVDKDILSPHPVKAPTFFTSVLHATDLEAAASTGANDVRSCDDTFPDPPTAEEWAKMEPELTWSECVRRAQACAGMAMKETEGVQTTTATAVAMSGRSERSMGPPGSPSLVEAEEGTSMVSFLEVAPTPDVEETSIIIQEEGPTATMEVNIEKVKMDKETVEWMHDTLMAMVQTGALLNPR
jgi:hypothetical protein